MKAAWWVQRRKAEDRRTHLWEWLPWEVTLDRERGILGTVHGGLLCGFRLTPLDLSGRTWAEQREVMRRINTAWRQLPAETALWVVASRVPAVPPPPPDWPHPVQAWLDEQRRRAIGPLWENGLTFWVWHQAEARVSRVIRSLFVKRTGAERRRTLADEVESFWTMVSRLVSVMRTGVRSLTSMDSDTTLTALFARLSPEPHPVTTPRNPRAHLSHYLAQEMMYHPGLKPSIEAHGRHQAVRCLSFAEEGMPSESFPGMLSAWYTLPRDAEWSSRVVIQDRAAAAKKASNLQFNWGATQQDWRQVVYRMGSDERAPMRNRYVERQTEDADLARDELLSDQVVDVHHTTTFLARAWDAEAADATIRQLETMAHKLGLITRYERDNADDAFFGTLPGLPYVDVGTLPINSLNAIDLMPFHAPSRGRDRDTYLNSGPWLQVRTDECNPYAIVNHVRDNGHFKVVGPTRSGKSILAAEMVWRWGERPERHCDWWDIDGNARCLTLCLNGIYHDVGSDGRGYQPYALIGDPVERAWAYEWTLRLLEGVHVRLTESKRRYVSGALTQLAARPPRQWSLDGLLDVMIERPASEALMRPKQTADLKRLELERQEIRNVLKDYATGGIHQGLLDADTDRWGESWLHTFGLRGLLRKPALVDPVTSLLFHRAELRFSTSHPTVVVMDDAAVSWAFPQFEQNGKDWLVSTAKKAVSLGLFTHSLTQVFGSKIGSLLIESCLQTFCLPNSAARDAEMAPIYERLGCTHTDREAISTGTPQRDVYYLCDEVEERRMFRLDVSPAALKLLGRNREEDHQAMDRIIAVHGTDDFAYHWANHVGEPELAERLRRTASVAAD